VGRVDKYLAPRVRELCAIDVSGEMIRLAGVRLAGLPNVRLREVGNREFLSAFDSGRFDLVFSFLVLQHLEREDAFLYLRDAHRVLKPGGRLLTQFPNYLSPEYTRAFVESADAPARSPGRVRAYTEAEVRHTLETVGFQISQMWFGGHNGRPDEIYVAAVKPSGH
jgi:SAM-dependent methyltransferase